MHQAATSLAGFHDSHSVGIDTHRNHRAGSRDERRGGISLPAVQPDIRIGDADHRNGGNGRNPNSVAVCCG